MKVILHGTLREQFGESFEIATRVVGDAVEGLSRQQGWPAGTKVEIPGFDSEDLIWAEVDDAEIHVIPAMFGGGGKFFSIVLGAIEIGVGIALGGFSNPLGAALIISGATTMLMGVVSLFMKAPSVSKSQDPPASKYLGVNKNTTEIGTPITIAGGRINLFGQWLSIQSDADKLVHGVFPTNPT